MNKYTVNPNVTTTVEGKTLYQIVANHDLVTTAGNITAGATGGYIQYEGVNLDQSMDGTKVGNLTYTSWISAGKVFDNAQVKGAAVVGSSTALVHGNAVIENNVSITGSPDITDRAVVGGNVTIADNVKLFEQASVVGSAKLAGNVTAFGDAKISGNAILNQTGIIFGKATIGGNVTQAANATSIIYGNADVSGAYALTGSQIVSGSTKLTA